MAPHRFNPDPSTPGYCCCGLPKANSRQHVGSAMPLEGVAWPQPGPGATPESDSGAIRDAIRLAATRYKTFSANDVRKLLAGTPSNSNKVGACYAALIRAKEIRATGGNIASDDPATHGHRIAIYTAGPCLQRPVAA